MRVSLDGSASGFPIVRFRRSSQNLCSMLPRPKESLVPPNSGGTIRSEYASVVTPIDGGKVLKLGCASLVDAP